VRVSGTLITQFRKLLVTECEIFVSILIRFLDHDKPVWQRALVLEVVHELCAQPELLESFSLHYDMQSKSTKVCVEIFTLLFSFFLLCARHAGPQHLVRSDLTLAFAYGASDSRRVPTHLQSSSRPFPIISLSLSLFSLASRFSRARTRALCMRSSSPALPLASAWVLSHASFVRAPRRAPSSPRPLHRKGVSRTRAGSVDADSWYRQRPFTRRTVCCGRTQANEQISVSLCVCVCVCVWGGSSHWCGHPCRHCDPPPTHTHTLRCVVYL
jgi:hypothetical protein